MCTSLLLLLLLLVIPFYLNRSWGGSTKKGGNWNAKCPARNWCSPSALLQFAAGQQERKMTRDFCTLFFFHFSRSTNWSRTKRHFWSTLSFGDRWSTIGWTQNVHWFLSASVLHCIQSLLLVIVIAQSLIIISFYFYSLIDRFCSLVVAPVKLKGIWIFSVVAGGDGGGGVDGSSLISPPPPVIARIHQQLLYTFCHQHFRWWWWW